MSIISKMQLYFQDKNILEMYVTTRYRDILTNISFKYIAFKYIYLACMYYSTLGVEHRETSHIFIGSTYGGEKKEASCC